MKIYEGLFLVDNSEARRDYDAVSKNVASIIQKYGGEIMRSERWAERRLAYPIRRRDRGTYILVYFNASPESVVDIKRDCVIDEVILRTMILRVQALPEKEKEPETIKEPEKTEQAPVRESTRTEAAGDTPKALSSEPAPEPEAPAEQAAKTPAEPAQESSETVTDEKEQDVEKEAVSVTGEEPTEAPARESAGTEAASDTPKALSSEPAPEPETPAEPAQESSETVTDEKEQDVEEEPVSVTGEEPTEAPADGPTGQDEDSA